MNKKGLKKYVGVFTLLSSLIISLLLVSIEIQNYSNFLSSSFDSLIVEYNQEEQSSSNIYSELDTFLKENDGTVLKVVNDNKDGTDVTSYAYFGNLKSYNGFPTSEDFDLSSNPVSGTYKILDGISTDSVATSLS